MPTTDLSFLSDDLQRQREVAREALEEAKKIDQLLKHENIDPSIKTTLEDAKKSLLKVASDLAANVTHTSSAATISIVGGGYK